MTPLRKRMIEDLQLKGYSPATREAYLGAVCKLARHYRKSPANVSEEELRAYFLHVAQVERCARGTLKIAISGIRFLFAVTLQRHWPVLGLIRAGKEKKLPVVLSRAEVRSVLGCVRAPVYRVCLSTIYACGLRISEGVAVQVSGRCHYRSRPWSLCVRSGSCTAPDPGFFPPACNPARPARTARWTPTTCVVLSRQRCNTVASKKPPRCIRCVTPMPRICWRQGCSYV